MSTETLELRSERALYSAVEHGARYPSPKECHRDVSPGLEDDGTCLLRTKAQSVPVQPESIFVCVVQVALTNHKPAMKLAALNWEYLDKA